MKSITKITLQDMIVEALNALNGSASIVQICEYIWIHHENELQSSGNIFYTWQYDIRWAATELRKQNILKSAHISPSGVWELLRK